GSRASSRTRRLSSWTCPGAGWPHGPEGYYNLKKSHSRGERPELPSRASDDVCDPWGASRRCSPGRCEPLVFSDPADSRHVTAHRLRGRYDQRRRHNYQQHRGRSERPLDYSRLLMEVDELELGDDEPSGICFIDEHVLDPTAVLTRRLHGLDHGERAGGRRPRLVILRTLHSRLSRGGPAAAAHGVRHA